MSVDKRASLKLRGRGYALPFGGPARILGNNDFGGGIVFPYTPVIAQQNSVEYSQYDLTHTNYQISSFNKHKLGNIQVTAVFANQTQEEARYTFGVMHFLRVVTKMHFGVEDDNAGTPPPVLSFSAYGQGNFNQVPVLVAGFTLNYPDDVDFVEVLDTGTNWNGSLIPAVATISIDLIPHYSAARQRQFSLSEFADGKLYGTGYL